MQLTTTEDLLLANAVVIAIILFVFGVALARRGLFRWTTTGFWAWVAFALYFVVNPLASIRWNMWRYRMNLSLSGGIERAQWITLVTVLGIVVFNIAYLHTQTIPVRWKLNPRDERITVPMALVILGFSSVAAYSLLTFRTHFFSTNRGLVFEGSRFAGDVTGYDIIGHTFLFVPIAFLLLSQSSFRRGLGWLAGIGYILLSLPDAWARFSIISMLLLISLTSVVNKSQTSTLHTSSDNFQRNGINNKQRGSRTWPRLSYIIIGVILASVLQLRGHTDFDSGSLLELAFQIPNRIGEILASNDVSMLSSWYLASYIKDAITGYDYGLPFLNYVFLGALPYHFFPQKYFLVDWLDALRPAVSDPTILYLMRGTKPTLVGSFYANGGLVAVVVEMTLAGILSRKMDGMLACESPILVKAVGVSWMSMLWMIWGSHDFWGAVRLGSLLMPALVLWAISPKEPSSSVKQRSFSRKLSPGFRYPQRSITSFPVADE